MVKPLDAIEVLKKKREGTFDEKSQQRLKKEIFTLKTENITFQQERIKTENHLSVTQGN